MHIYSAQMTAASGRQLEASELITRVRDTASAGTGLAVSAWSTIAGAPYGSMALSMRVEGMEQFLDATAALATNEAWAALADDTARLIKEPAEIGWEQVIAATATDMASPALASINRAQIAPGHIKEAVGRSSEMLNFVKEATGIDGMLTMTDAGPTNEIAFIFGVDSGAAADAANAALAANADWVDMMDAAAGMFVTGTNHRVYAARLP